MRVATRLVTFVVGVAVLVGFGVAGPTVAIAQLHFITPIFTYNAENSANAVNASGVVAGTKYPCCIDAPTAGFLWANGESGFENRPAELRDFGFDAINTAGAVAGSGLVLDANFVWRSRAIVGMGTTLYDLQLPDARAHDLNDDMRIVGEYTEAGIVRGFDTNLSDDFIPIGTLGGANSRALGINAAGTVVGAADLADGTTHAFLAAGDHSNLVDLGTLGGANSVAYDVNASGVAVGSAQDENGVWYPAVFQNGSVRKLGTVPGAAEAINDDGVIVGTLQGSVPFRAAAGVVTDLNELIPPESGWLLQTANDINASGQIVGEGYLTTGSWLRRGFLLTPQTTGSIAPERRGLSMRALPSVTSAGTRLVFGSALPTSGRLDLVDVSGRALRRIPLAAGIRSVDWDGRDESGRPVAPGCVLARATAGDQEARTRLFFVR